MSAKCAETVFFGKPITVPCLIPVLHSATPNCVAEPFTADGTPYKVTALSFGTPHGAVLVDDVDAVDVPTLGRALGTHPRFPQGASIVFLQHLGGNRIKARLWGESTFTNEAACVAGVAAMMNQVIPVNKAEVIMGGKTVFVTWDRETGVSLSC